MTASKVMERVDRVRPNAYGEEDKLSWLSDLDGMVRRLVLQEAEGAAYRYPEDMDAELLISAPWEEVYVLYLSAMIDYHNQEYDHYNNAVQMFYARFDEYKKAYIRENRPESAGSFKL